MEAATNMLTLVRLLVTFVVFTATYLFVYWVPFSLIEQLPEPVALAGAAVCGLLAAGAVWKGTQTISHGLIGSAFYWAAVVGAIGFVGGFIGPILLTPDANQGPLLGIFITGPLGFVLGGIGGTVAWLMKRRGDAHEMGR